MGQRHQIYVKMPEKLGITGFHHNWLYGMAAVESLARVVKFYITEDAEGPLHKSVGYGVKGQSELIRSLYSVNFDAGQWSFVHPLHDAELDDYPEVQDPRQGHNNDGITIIDLSQGDFRYCFMNIGHLEGEINPKDKLLKPMSAREYLLCYYPKFMDKLGDKLGNERDCKRQPIENETFDRLLHALRSIEKNTKLLTLAECKKLFPKMYKKERK